MLEKEVRLTPTLLISTALFLVLAGCGGGGSNNGSGSGSGGVNSSDTCRALASNLALPQWPNAPQGYALYKPVLDDSNVYWFEYDQTQGNSGGLIKAVAKSGGTPQTLASGLKYVNAMAADGVNVYWTEYDPSASTGAIKSVPKAGGPVTTLASGTPAGSMNAIVKPTGIVLDSNRVYWADTMSTAIRSVPKAGGQVSDIMTSPLAAWLALDSTSTYFYFSDGEGNYGRVPFSGGSAQSLASNLGFSGLTGGITVDPQSVYWIGGASQGTDLFALPVGGATPTYLLQNMTSLTDVALDDNSVYYVGSTNPGNTSPWKLPKAGGTPVAYQGCTAPFAGQPPAQYVVKLAVDSTNLFAIGVANDGSGVLVTIPK